MKKERLTRRPDGQNISVSTHIFFYITLMFGIVFVLPPTLFDTIYSPLYQFTVARDWHFWWGVGLLVVSVSNTLMLYTRSRFFASFVGALGFCLWLFAGFAYLYMGYVFGFLVVALPNMVFWAWYSIMVARFRNSLDA